MCNRVFGDIQGRSLPRQTEGLIGAAERGSQLGAPVIRLDGGGNVEQRYRGLRGATRGCSVPPFLAVCPCTCKKPGRVPYRIQNEGSLRRCMDTPLPPGWGILSGGFGGSRRTTAAVDLVSMTA